MHEGFASHGGVLPVRHATHLQKLIDPGVLQGDGV